MHRSAWIATITCVTVLALGSGLSAREGERRLRAEMRRQMRMSVDPGSLLQGVYANYIMLKRCHEARRDSLATFIDAGEWARADEEARSLRERIKAFAPSVNDDIAWRLASSQVDPLSQNAQNCRGALAALDNLYTDVGGER